LTCSASIYIGGLEGEGDDHPDGEIGGNDGLQKSEIYNMDYKMGKCSNSAPALIQSSLYDSALESLYSTYVTVSIDSTLYLDFVEMDGMIDTSTEDQTELTGMSTSVVLFSWAMLGAITGLVAYFAYGFYVQFTGHDALFGGNNKDIIQSAQNEHEMSCKFYVLKFIFVMYFLIVVLCSHHSNKLQAWFVRVFVRYRFFL
jgi:hypothetical protein